MVLCENCCFYDEKENLYINENARFNIDDECFLRIDIEDYTKIYNKAINTFKERLLELYFGNDCWDCIGGNCYSCLENTVDYGSIVDLAEELKEE